VGTFTPSDGTPHWFLYSADTYTTIADPLPISDSIISGINDSGEIVGYDGGPGGTTYGFAVIGGLLTVIQDPLAVKSTYVTGVNDHIVGD
jgi:hypothetical protein